MTEQQMIDYLRKNGYEVYSKEEDEERENDFVHLSEDYKQNVIAKCKLRKELKEIKKKFESGQAVILPCNVGDKVSYKYNDTDIANGEVVSISIEKNGVWFHAFYYGGLHMWHLIDELGKTVFIKDEAKLKELRGE